MSEKKEKGIHISVCVLFQTPKEEESFYQLVQKYNYPEKFIEQETENQRKLNVNNREPMKV
ncbi:hypothetical protein JRC49_14990 [Clostridiales bacterium FE2011]|nr:hypothetical protein JRC49_14990 [Clostridiales bacterium FE2011]QTE75030.1 hypothetical protein JS518_03850 [Clostridiales bacterium FE2010]